MRILGLVPARAGSKGIQHKNIKDLDGKPLMYYAIQNVIDVLGECFVSTDSEYYAGLAEELGAGVLERPASLSQDDTRLIQVLSYHCEGFDGVLCQPPTAPLVKPQTLLKLLDGAHRGSSSVTVSQSREWGRILGSEIVYPRQNRPKKYVLDGCASFRGSEMLSECNLHTNALWKPNFVEIRPPENLNIDDEYDWGLAEHFMRLENG